MPFRTQNIQIDGSLNIDGSLFLWQVPFTGGTADVSDLSIESYVNSSSYYDGSLMYWTLPNPSTGLGSPAAQGIHVNFTTVTGTTHVNLYPIYCTTNGRVTYADADASNLMPAIGINMTGSTISSGIAANFVHLGVIRSTLYNFLIGKTIYIGQSSGYPTTTIPSGTNVCIQVIGQSQSNDTVILRPSPNFIQLK